MAVSFTLLGVWLYRIFQGCTPLKNITCEHHVIGPAELTTAMIFVLLGSWIFAYGHEYHEQAQWQPKDRLYLVNVVGFLCGFVVLLFVGRINAIRSGRFGLGHSRLIRTTGRILLYFVVAMGLTTAALIATVIVCQWVGYENIQVHETLSELKQFTALRSRILLIVPAVLIAPVYEEVLFRGIFQGLFARIANWFSRSKPIDEDALEGFVPALSESARWYGIIIAALCFAVAHADWQHVPALFVLGLCLGYSYERTGNLLTSIGIHMTFNSLQIVLTILSPTQAV